MKSGNTLPPGILIRKFRVEDLEVVKQLVDTTITISYREAYPQEAIDYFLLFHSSENIREDAERGCTIVLETDRIVGTGTLLGSEIKRVFVDPSLHRLGLGALLIEALEHEALQRGIRKVSLAASLPSKQFYDTLGYVTECRTFLPVQHGKRLDYFTMIKNLG
jgi:GNAT superfamily N-acetyltransferase